MDEFPILSSSRKKDDGNRSSWMEMLEELREITDQAKSQGPQKYINRHIARGQLLPRERIELVLDPDSPFLEIMPLAGYGQEGTHTGGSVVCGIGLVW